MKGKIDASFQTEQRDMFASGIVAEIGVNAYAVWSAIKYHADFQTGEAWPGMRRLGELVGLSKSAVDRAVDALEAAKLLRVVKSSNKRRGQTYVARERMAVRLGSRVLCTIVIDYVPAKMRGTLDKIEKALEGKAGSEAFADVEIIPGEGFLWDATENVLRGRIEAREVPPSDEDDHFRKIGEAILNRRKPLIEK
jgi:DNA-binding Lrp family transcriptional regulator